MALKQPKYYPRRHAVLLAAEWRRAVRTVSTLGIVSFALLAGAMNYESLTLPAVVSLALFIPVTWATGFGLVDMVRYIRIVPYFDREVGDINTYVIGQSLAKYCEKLDGIASAHNEATLSSFGFNDDLYGEQLVWHSAQCGLRTVTLLTASVRERADEFEDHAGLVRDLDCLSHALTRADEKDIRFCLLLLHGDGTSGHEWDIRKGYAF